MSNEQRAQDQDAQASGQPQQQQQQQQQQQGQPQGQSEQQAQPGNGGATDVDGLANKKPEELTPEELRLMADTMPGEGPGD
ncbi:hypothetical protein [Massilia consociata]|uniref:Uncharacterized protein n=1 Tax=Massilia consociata TaxID=760117 RepID=A0ABV6FHM0_9BURK